jgi:hypothetical protein
MKRVKQRAHGGSHARSPYAKYGKTPYPYTPSSLATASEQAKEENRARHGWRPGKMNLDPFNLEEAANG